MIETSTQVIDLKIDINMIEDSGIRTIKELKNTSFDEHCRVSKNEDSDQAIEHIAISMKKLIGVSSLCIIFMIGEIVGGLLSNSVSIQTDAVHMASEIVGFFLIIIAIFVSENKPTRRMSYGFYRSEILGALFSTIVIWVLTGILIYIAIIRIINQNFEIEPIPMLITASLAVVFNILMYFTLHKKLLCGIKKKLNASINPIISQENFSNLDINEKEIDVETTIIANISLRSISAHVVGDFIQSLGVLIAAIIVYLKPEYKLADPICTFMFSALVIITTAPIIRDIYFVLMEALPVSINYDAVIKDLCKIENVNKAHNLHVWCLTMDRFALSVHLVTDKDIDTQKVLKDANYLFRSKYRIENATIQIEYFEDGSTQDCLVSQLSDNLIIL